MVILLWGDILFWSGPSGSFSNFDYVYIEGRLPKNSGNDKMGWIYMIRNKVNGKCYIGQTRRKKVEFRWYQHKNRPGIMKSAFDKHGVENFEFSVICEIPTEELNAREILEIRERNTLYPNGYNLESGGNTNVITHPETRKKMSEANKGKKNPNFGKTHTEETRKKMREAQKGKKASEETRKKLSEAQKGKKATEETRAKISDATKGENNPNFGKKASEETRKKISEAMRWKSVRQLSVDGDLIAVFDSMIQAGESLGSDYSGISKCCRGKAKTSGGFKWEYSITL